MTDHASSPSSPSPSSPSPSPSPSGPLPVRTTDYAHARHVGNVGDVFKHVALCATAAAFREGPVLYAESHAGDGLFTLGSVGEWTVGVQKLWPVPGAPACMRPSIARYLEAIRTLSRPETERPEKYPGSPLLARTLLPTTTKLILHELDPNAAAVLRRALASGPHISQVLESDGFVGLPKALAENPGSALVLIDPPYTSKEEWTRAAACVADCHQANPAATLLLWYPLKALTRPRALLADLVKRDLHGTLVELLSTPLRLKRDRLAGSGMILVNPPAGAIEELSAALPVLGPPLATHGEWSSNLIGF